MTPSPADDFTQFLASILRIRAESPTGDTAPVAQFIAEWLGQAGVVVSQAESKPGSTNAWASIGDPQASRHLTFCTHLDTFPAGDPSRWTSPPFDAAIVGDRIIARGAGAARTGLAGLLWIFREFALDGLPAGTKLSWIGAADTESGGTWGAGWVADNVPSVVGTACLLGEPEGPGGMRIGEKGKAQFRLTATSAGGPGALESGTGPIIDISHAIHALQAILDVPHQTPADITHIIASMDGYSRNAAERNMTGLLTRPAFSVGKINGGSKVNLVPESVTAEVDVRVPFGMSSDEIYAYARKLLSDAGVEGVTLEPMPPAIEPSWTPSDDSFVESSRRAVERVTGQLPTLSLGFASTDARYFRPRGIPSIIYGPTPINVGSADEATLLAEFPVLLDAYREITRSYLLGQDGR